ncbi:MAG: glycosyltransferase family 4 protein, partial [Anaerolineae bacterium]|nr:glycosyltransferase family 4 protein [Anaerolineae bacterium]
YRMRFQSYRMLYNPQTVGDLKRLYAHIRPDVLNAHVIHNGLSYFSLTLAHRMGIPVVFTAHDVMPFAYQRLTHFVDPAHCGVQSPEQYRLPPFFNLRQARFRYNPIRNLALRYILTHHVRRRTCVSEAHRQALEANDLPPFQVVHNGIAAARFQSTPEAVERLRVKLGTAGRKVILFGGRLTADKGSYQLLAAFKLLVERLPEALLLVLSRVGLDEQGLNTPEFRHLRETHVRSGGWLSGDELAAAYGLADVVTVPSICLDCFPTINLEAMAAGKPVVATCYGGSPESVVDGETGYIVNPFDSAALAERLERLLRDAELRARMGAAGQRRIAEHFTLAHQVRAMEQVYRDVVDK